MRRLDRFLSLSTTERRLLVEAALLLTTIRPGLNLLSFQTVRQLLSRAVRRSARSREAGYSSAERVVWAVTTMSRYVPGASVCLTRALAAQTMLARRGHPALLRIGVARDEQRRLQAHAWVESAGEAVIGGENLDRYTSLPALEREKP